MAVTDGDPTVPVHAVWHPVHVQAGPYAIDGELPTIPGFDPDRALTRPTGSFVVLRDVRMRREDDVGWTPVVVAEALVNRYIVELVEADCLLGFLLPGRGVHPHRSGRRRVAADRRGDAYDRLTDQALARRRTGFART